MAVGRVVAVAVVLILAVGVAPGAGRGLRGRPPGLDCTVQELFGRWLRAAGGEASWKGLRDIRFDLIETERELSFGIVGSRVVKRVWVKIQPRLRMRVEFIDEKGFRRVYGYDSRGYYLYREEVPASRDDVIFRRPVVESDPTAVEPIQTYLKGLAFWLGMPFTVQLPGTQLRFGGFLAPLRDGAKPLPILEIDLSAIPDYPIDLVILAFNPETWQPVDGRYRFTGEKDAAHQVQFYDFTSTIGIRYPRTRIFIDEAAGGELETEMQNVEPNARIHERRFERPVWLERAR